MCYVAYLHIDVRNLVYKLEIHGLCSPEREIPFLLAEQEESEHFGQKLQVVWQSNW